MSHAADERPELEDKLSELEILRQSLEESKEKQKQFYDQLLRLGAEFENFRKRSEARVADARRAGKEDVLLELVSLCDALIQAEVATKNASDVDAVKQGVTMVFQQFERFLKTQGIAAIKTVGEKLDPHRHEAIAQEEKADAEEGTITDEVQRGYTFNDRVIRPAKVRVSKKPAEAPSN